MFEWWATVEPLAWVGGKLLIGFHLVRNFIRPSPPALHWRERLNMACGPDLHVHRILDCEPDLLIQGQLKLTEEQARIAARHRKKLKINDPVAILAETSPWDDDPVALRVYATDYAAVCALDELGSRPTMLSANALLYCRETDEVVLHRRSDVSRDYPG